MMTILEILQDEQKNLNNRLERWEEHKDFLQPIIDSFKDDLTHTSLTNSLDLHIMGDAALLAKVFKKLRSEGYELQSGWERPKAGEISWSGYFKHQYVSEKIWVNFTSSVCKRVQVGTRMEEIPVYEVRCNETVASDPEL